MIGTRAAGLVAGMLSAVSAPPQGARAGDWPTTSGDVLETALPVAAATCATRQQRLASYATGFIALTAATQRLKYGLGDASLNERPNGQSHGFPSGHTGAAASDATDIAVHCAPGNRAVAATNRVGVAMIAGGAILVALQV